ncbi:MAG: hypothetical protein ACI93R_001404 [Flavobacteriales bacterium]|jgi:hypothetical protein
MTSNTDFQQAKSTNTQEMIWLILNDIGTSYTPAGEEITSIKLTAPNTYLVSLSQEAFIKDITYTLNIDKECAVSIISRTASTRISETS